MIDYTKFTTEELEQDLDYQHGLLNDHENLDQPIYAGYARQELEAIQDELARRRATEETRMTTPLYSFKVAGETLDVLDADNGTYMVTCYPSTDNEWTVLSRGTNRYNVVRSAARRFKDQFATA